MKQRITVNQLHELTPDQQNKLREWWSIHRQQGDVFICHGNDFLNGKTFAWDGHNKPFNMAIPLVSIGQCLSILERYAPMLGMKHGCYGSWYLEIWTEESHKIFEDKECVDVCFQAVKSIL